jgi:hypothetical protein
MELIGPLKLIEGLADSIEFAWREASYDHREFPQLAAELLAEARLTDELNWWELLRWVCRSDLLAEQRDLSAGFSNLPVTLVNRPRFYIDLYVWLDGTTTIHQHSFSGAFQVLEGSSLHSRYRFEEHRWINEHFRQGEVVFESSELLRQGMVREIVAGDGFAHSLFHLARPSATITVRTYQDVTALPQLNYLKPSIAIDPFFSDQWMTKRVQTIPVMLAVHHPEVELAVRDCVRLSDEHTAFLLLAEVDRWSRQPSLQQMFEPEVIANRTARLFDFARSAYGGELIDEFVKVFAEQEWAAEIVKRRGQVINDDHRFFLALLLNLPDREEITRMVWAYAPQRDPLESMMDWIDSLGSTRDLRSTEPNVLGLRDWNEGSLFLAELLLAGKSSTEIAAAIEEELPNLPAIRQETAEEWVRRMCEEFRVSSLRALLEG